MKTVFSEAHALQSVQTEFYRGKWVEAFEIPRRAELVPVFHMNQGRRSSGTVSHPAGEVRRDDSMSSTARMTFGSSTTGV